MRLLERWRKRLRERRILRECGCICYCPRCRDPLNDQAPAKEALGLVCYVCSKCGKRSDWLFDAPVPIFLDGEGAR